MTNWDAETVDSKITAVTFPRLFKLSTGGKLMIWDIRVEGSTIITNYGQEDGAISEARDLVKEGKNIGNSNETTPEQQARLDAISKFEKQQKHKGYVQDRDKALAGLRFRNAPVPMLAHPIEQRKGGKDIDNRHRIKYPVAMQPKLDGFRCLARYQDGVVTLHARTGDTFKNVPHITEQIKELLDSLGIEEIVLDGELYCHKLNRNFAKIQSIIKRLNEVHPEHRLIEYHVYDVIRYDDTFEQRNAFLSEILPNDYRNIKVVETGIAHREEDWADYFNVCLGLGYEGTMLKNLEAKYVSKRTYDLLKIKDRYDEEFKIIGVNSGRGSHEGLAATFTCLTKDGVEFYPTVEGDHETLRKYLEDESTWKGKYLTVTHFGYGSQGAPRCPKGKAIRAGESQDLFEVVEQNA